jgi:uncharacterized protein YifE (UPF0438 family)
VIETIVTTQRIRDEMNTGMRGKVIINLIGEMMRKLEIGKKSTKVNVKTIRMRDVMKAEGRDATNIDVGREKTITEEESEGMNILRTGKTMKEVREMRGDRKITRKIQGMMEVRKTKEMRNGGRVIRRMK